MFVDGYSEMRVKFKGPPNNIEQKKNIPKMIKNADVPLGHEWISNEM